MTIQHRLDLVESLTTSLVTPLYLIGVESPCNKSLVDVDSKDISTDGPRFVFTKPVPGVHRLFIDVMLCGAVWMEKRKKNNLNSNKNLRWIVYR